MDSGEDLHLLFIPVQRFRRVLLKLGISHVLETHMAEGRMCRICLEVDNARLLSPCKCSGRQLRRVSEVCAFPLSRYLAKDDIKSYMSSLQVEVYPLEKGNGAIWSDVNAMLRKQGFGLRSHRPGSAVSYSVTTVFTEPGSVHFLMLSLLWVQTTYE